MQAQFVLPENDVDNFERQMLAVTAAEVQDRLGSNNLTAADLPILISPAAEKILPQLIKLAQKITIQHFGRTIKMYAPVYLSNFCVNDCAYCNFNRRNQVVRRRLSLPEIVAEAEYLHKAGFRHILLVAGEDPAAITLDYLSGLIRELKNKFSGVAIEVAPQSASGYQQLAAAGLDGLVIYQETYDRNVYGLMHAGGQKKDFDRRLHTAENGGAANLRELGIGFLLGLAPWRREAFFLVQHAKFLLKHFWRSQLSISFPRIQPIENNFTPPYPVSDQELIQLIVALRIIFPQVELTLSTRENPALRDRLVGVGITRMSAASSTVPGGYTNLQNAGAQFMVADERSASQVAAAVTSAGYDPVFKDWEIVY